MLKLPAARRLQGNARDASIELGSAVRSPPKPRSRVQSEVRFSEANGNGDASPSSTNASPSVSSRQQQHCVQDREGNVRNYSVGFDARSSYMHFAQHRTKIVATTKTGDLYMGTGGRFRNFLDRLGWHESKRAASVRVFLRSRVWQSVVMGALFVALFFADVFVLLQVPSNFELDFILTLALIAFVTDLTLLSATDIGYPCSFFFFMDVVGSLSMMYDISYMKGPDATQAVRLSEKTDSGSLVVLRAARAARLGARAGRLSRVVKVLRFLNPQADDGDADQVQVAKVISSKLQDALSMRVAFLTICVAVALPIFKMFEYPEMDDSLEAWVQMISSDVDAYLTTKTTASMEALMSGLGRFGSFYDGSPYGPFDVCYGKGIAHSFTCKKSVLPLPFTSVFHAPRRRASIMEIVDGDVQVFYDMSGVAQMEAAMNIGVIVFLILVMIGFSIVLSYSITEIALMPLERMLSVVRSRCAEIFKYTADLNQSGGDQPDDSRGAAASDASAASEFVLLEKAVSKLAAIVHLSAKPTEPDVNDELTEDAVMVLNWTQGQNAVVIQQAVSDTGSASGRTSSGRTSFVASSGRRQTIRSHASSTMTPRRRATLRQSTRAGKRASLDRTSLISIVEEETEHKMKIAETMAAHVPLETTKSLHGPDFDAFDTSFSSEMQVGLVLYIFYITPGACDYVQASVDKEVMQKFVVKAQEGYSPNKFHNFAHALDVAYEVSTKIRLVEAGRFMYEVGTQQFWLLVAALGLDLGHVGVNNQFLIETKHELAVTYNDKSPLENLHCSMLFQILSNDDANVLKFLDKDGYREARKFIIDAILHTDVVKHSEMVKALSLLYQMNTAFFPARGWSEDTNEVLTSQAQLASNALLHLSDVGNPTKRWPAARRLAMLSMEEFFLQGDQEKALGFPVSMLNDRDKVNLPSSQIGFIEFMVLPLVEAMVHIFPALCDRAKNLERNTQEWRDLWIGEDGHNEVAVEKMSTRVQKVQQRCSEVYKSPEPVASPRNAMRRQEVNMSLGLLLPSDADPL